MELEIFTLCDAATDHAGKLNILGAFDTIHAQQAPATHATCAVALRIRFTRVEEGVHAFRLALIDDDGRAAIPAVDGQLTVKMPQDGDSMAANLVINFQGLKLVRFGAFHFDLAIDGRQCGRIPLHFRRIG